MSDKIQKTTSQATQTTSSINDLLEQDEIKERTDLTEKVIDDPEEFRAAVGQAQLSGITELVVSQRMMNFLLKPVKGQKNADHFTTGNPGIVVYVEGKKDEIKERNAKQHL